MTKNNPENLHWTICTNCQGQGKIVRGPSKRRRRLHELELALYEKTAGKGIAPKPLTDNLDICLSCAGSGLQSADADSKVPRDVFPHIAIVGGGISGTALAVACLHRGIPFTLYERDQSFDARSQGYGLTLQQASKAIEALGVTSLPDSVVSTRHVVHNPEGKIIGEWGLRKWRQGPVPETSRRKNIHIARQTLRSALLEQLHESESVKWGHELITVAEQESGSSELTFKANDTTEVVTADLVVGADGIRSRVRELLIDEKKNPLQYLGCIVILGICPLKALADTQSPLFDSATVFQTVSGRERMYAMPYDHDTIMWQVSFPVDEAKASELSTRGKKAMKEEVCRRLAWHEPIPQILAATAESDITGYPVYDRPLLDPALLHEAGAMTLLGDAAHPMSPFKGQGANQALLDALALARSMYAKCGPGSDWREAGLRRTILDTFEADMLKRTASKVQDSAKAVELLHSDAVLHEGDEPRGRGLV